MPMVITTMPTSSHAGAAGGQIRQLGAKSWFIHLPQASELFCQVLLILTKLGNDCMPLPPKVHTPQRSNIDKNTRSLSKFAI
jgi:hypothetical protein